VRSAFFAIVDMIFILGDAPGKAVHLMLFRAGKMAPALACDPIVHRTRGAA
jgi:hypothetical protein